MRFRLAGKKNMTGGSLSLAAWKKFLENKMAVISMVYLLIVFFISAVGYLFIPDSTPKTNRQNLEIGAEKPGFSILMFKEPKDAIEDDDGFLSRIFKGRRDRFTYIPIDSYHISDSLLTIAGFTGESNLPGPEKTYKLSDVSVNKNIFRRTYLLGTDQFGRDLLSRLVIGARVSLSVGFVSVFISLLIGIFVGAIGGHYGGKADKVVMWLINVVWSIPTLLLVIAITFALGRGFWQIFIAVGFTMWVEVARVTRGQILSVRQKEFVEAARAMGFSDSRIILRHILPNIAGPVIIISAANFASAILIEAGLSFLGIGVQPPMPSWGNMIRENYAYLLLDAPHLAILPGLAIMITVLACMIIGNGLRDAMDVKAENPVGI